LCCLRHGAISFLGHFRFRFSSTAFGAGCFADRGCGELRSPFGSLRPHHSKCQPIQLRNNLHRKCYSAMARAL
jgi:hypothetical protein